MMGFAVAGQGDTLIPFVIGERFQEAFLTVLLALDAPHIADKIARITIYLSPFLIGQIWYGFYDNHFLPDRDKCYRVPATR